MNCLNCEKPLTYTTGKKKKKFCNDSCRIIHWQNAKKKETNNKVVPQKEWNALQAELISLRRVAELYNDLVAINKELPEILDTGKPALHVNPSFVNRKEFIEEMEPKENTNRFYLKHGYFTHEEMNNAKR